MHVLQAREVSIKIGNQSVLDHLSFTIEPGNQYAVTGPSGSGKTLLLQAIAGMRSYTGSIEKGQAGGKVVLIEQQHHFKNLSNTSTFYYQQRFNSSDSEDAITVAEDLQKNILVNQDPAYASAEMQRIIRMLHLEDLLGSKLIKLSNGENKRLQIAKALLRHPSLLLLDKPFTGLDTETRAALSQLLEEITRNGLHIVLVTTEHQVPSFITHVLQLDLQGKGLVQKVADWKAAQAAAPHANRFVPDEQLLSALLAQQSHPAFGSIVRMNRVHVQYNQKVILDNINWEVKEGEKWSLSGPNGAGKSTLLSLVNADNPQAYANDISLFGRRRGTGETIWDIKKKTGYVSPELHLFFEQSVSCFEVVASGLFDTIGLFRVLHPEQEKAVVKWMTLLKVQHLRGKLLKQASLSEQRLVLLTRALVKNPPLLILDEPCQGLDEDQVIFFRSMIDEICTRSNKTLIYVSHYPHEIPACVNQFIRLEGGRRVV